MYKSIFILASCSILFTACRQSTSGLFMQCGEIKTSPKIKKLTRMFRVRMFYDHV